MVFLGIFRFFFWGWWGGTSLGQAVTKRENRLGEFVGPRGVHWAATGDGGLPGLWSLGVMVTGTMSMTPCPIPPAEPRDKPSVVWEVR